MVLVLREGIVEDMKEGLQGDGCDEYELGLCWKDGFSQLCL